MIHDRRMDRAIDRTRANVPLTPIEVGLTAAIVAVEAEEPHILVAADPNGGIRAGLPFGPFDPLSHRTFEIGLRNWVAAQTAINVGYVEQLYTFGAVDRDPRERVVTVAYYALVKLSDHRVKAATDASKAEWFQAFKTPKLAFDHAIILETALQRLQGKVRYQPIGFELLPPK
jgi:hypothetical protein